MIRSPGQEIRAIMDDDGLSVPELAIKTKFSRDYIRDLLNDKRRISAKMAIALSKVFYEHSPKAWLEIQNLHDLKKEGWTENGL